MPWTCPVTWDLISFDSLHLVWEIFSHHVLFQNFFFFLQKGIEWRLQSIIPLTVTVSWTKAKKNLDLMAEGKDDFFFPFRTQHLPGWCDILIAGNKQEEWVFYNSAYTGQGPLLKETQWVSWSSSWVKVRTMPFGMIHGTGAHLIMHSFTVSLQWSFVSRRLHFSAWIPNFSCDWIFFPSCWCLVLFFVFFLFYYTTMSAPHLL